VLQDKELTSEEREKTKKFIEESKKSKEQFKKEVLDDLRKNQGTMGPHPGMMPFMPNPMMFSGMPPQMTPEMAAHFGGGGLFQPGGQFGMPGMTPGYGFSPSPMGNGSQPTTKSS
jgi:hypothetical protein